MKETHEGKSHKKLLAIILALAIVTITIISLIVVILAEPKLATDVQYLSPTSYPVGSTVSTVLVVYDPGADNSGKSVASQIASNLQAQGYYVDLAGIDSSVAKGNLAQFTVIVVGGPLDNNGMASSKVQSYLRTLAPANGTKVGVFGVGNYIVFNNKIAPLPGGSTLAIKEIHEIDLSQDTTQSAEFITQLLS